MNCSNAQMTLSSFHSAACGHECTCNPCSLYPIRGARHHCQYPHISGLLGVQKTTNEPEVRCNQSVDQRDTSSGAARRLTDLNRPKTNGA